MSTWKARSSWRLCTALRSRSRDGRQSRRLEPGRCSPSDEADPSRTRECESEKTSLVWKKPETRAKEATTDRSHFFVPFVPIVPCTPFVPFVSFVLFVSGFVPFMPFVPFVPIASLVPLVPFVPFVPAQKMCIGRFQNIVLPPFCPGSGFFPHLSRDEIIFRRGTVLPRLTQFRVLSGFTKNSWERSSTWPKWLLHAINIMTIVCGNDQRVDRGRSSRSFQRYGYVVSLLNYKVSK